MPMRPPRTARIACSDKASVSVPSRSTRPASTRPFSGSSRISASAVMLLPQPLSPTRAKVSPRCIDRRRPSIARTQARFAVEADFEVLDLEHVVPPGRPKGLTLPSGDANAVS